LREVILKERNEAVTPESITMWFKRHRGVYEQLKKEVIEELKPLEVVDESIFNNGTFEELPSVKNWIEEMEDRHLAPEFVKNRIGTIKRLCRGYDLDEWTFKHPDRLTLDEARDYIRKMREKGMRTDAYRLSVRDFLLSKGIAAGKKISGATEAGKYKKLHLPVEIEQEFFEGVKSLNFEAYVADLFERKTGTRVDACLESLIENIEGNYITVFDKGRRSIHPKGHLWLKYIPPELMDPLRKLIGDRQVGKIFNIRVYELRNINSAIQREMIQKHANEPKIVELLKMCLKLPTHWLRHQFFQRCLHQTGWNYGACAALGGSTVKSLEESYGAPPDEMVKQWGLEYVPQI